jgi:protein-serine/threonine kinase
MLAGYLPFDDDPANPEGDNINLLYKYIVSTHLTFPEYVTPHARDLLKRILVPDPRKRADLFEVARHSWLSDFAHVVGFITSANTTHNDIGSTTVPACKFQRTDFCWNSRLIIAANYAEAPSLARSASVREPHKSHVPATAVVGGLTPKQGTMDVSAQESARATREAKRRTVQLEYVPPQSSTTRGDGKSRARTGAQDAAEVVQDYSRQSTSMAPPNRHTREQARAASETVAQAAAAGYSSQRPGTGGSLAGARLSSRGNSYGQPSVVVSQEEAQGRFSQPSLAQYNVSSPLPQEEGRPGDRRSYMGPDFGQAGFPEVVKAPGARRSQAGHRRSNTVSGLSEKLFGFSKRGSIFGKTSEDDEKLRKSKKSHPPVSMKTPLPNDNNAAFYPAEPRKSSDSRRTSFSLGRKSSGTHTNAQEQDKRASRRFSFIPSFGRHDKDKDANTIKEQRPKIAFGRGDSRSPSRSTTASSIPVVYNSDIDRQRNVSQPNPRTHQAPAPYPEYPTSNPGQYPPNTESEYYSNGIDRDDAPTPTLDHSQNPHNSYPDQHNALPGQSHAPHYPTGFNSYDDPRPASGKHTVLQKQRRGFNDAYEGEGKHDGSSGAARRVMDFFRKRGKARTGD